MSSCKDPLAQFDLADKDTSNFECLTFKDDSVYYGEVGLFDREGNKVQAENEDPEEVALAKSGAVKEGVVPRLVNKRHGTGVQIFSNIDGSILCKYEGEWSCGLKEGQGVATYPDGSVYIGRFGLIKVSSRKMSNMAMGSLFGSLEVSMKGTGKKTK